jgi:hypothetical protein
MNDQGYFRVVFIHPEVDMVTLAQSAVPKMVRITFMKKRDDLRETLTPRFCMIIPTGMILAGLGIPALILIQLLPASLLLCGAGFALVAFGGIMWLIFYGDL